MQARTLPAIRGRDWLLGGFRLWSRNPLGLTAGVMTAMLVSVLLGSIPWIGSLLICFIAPAFDVMLLRICEAIAQGRLPQRRRLAAEAQRNWKSLFVLGCAMFLLLMLSKGLSMAIGGEHLDSFMQQAATGQATSVPPAVLWASIVNMLCVAVISVIMWIAPPLAAFGDLSPVKALFFSLIAVWRNKAAFLVFGVCIALLTIPLSIVLLLGQLGQILAVMFISGVLSPACIASNYLSVTDIFGPLPEPRDGD